MDNSAQIHSSVEEFLTSRNFVYKKDSDNTYSFQLRLHGVLHSCYFYITVREDDVSISADLEIEPDSEDKGLMDRVYEFICRANFGLNIGHFEIDPEYGDINARFYINATETIPTADDIDSCVKALGNLAEIYGRGFASVILAGADAAEAIAQCEANM